MAKGRYAELDWGAMSLDAQVVAMADCWPEHYEAVVPQRWDLVWPNLSDKGQFTNIKNSGIGLHLRVLADIASCHVSTARKFYMAFVRSLDAKAAYERLYRDTDAWARIVNEALLAREFTPLIESEVWKKYLRQSVERSLAFQSGDGPRFGNAIYP